MQVRKVTGINPEKRTFVPSKKLVLSRRFIGIEIEAENVASSKNIPDLWTAKSDGSLRNGGVELVSDVVCGADILTALDSAEKWLTAANATFSDRCSVHIHLDVRHLDVEELVYFLAMYAIFEKFFFMQSGDETREFNNHCRPVCSSIHLGYLLQGLLSSNTAQIKRSFGGWPKYSAFNLHPVVDQGSIEIRHHVGTGSKEEIIRWINLIFSLAHYCHKNYQTRGLQSEIDRVCPEGEVLFKEIFPAYKEHWSPRLLESMVEGARYIQTPLNTVDSERRVRALSELTKAEARPVDGNVDALIRAIDRERRRLIGEANDRR